MAGHDIQALPNCAFRLMGTYARGVPLTVKNRELAGLAGLRVMQRIGKLPDLAAKAQAVADDGGNQARCLPPKLRRGMLDRLSMPQPCQEIRIFLLAIKPS
ncbi:hypothetical protein [Rhodanobacter sp. L36]|uniref:hypothetical protein n=1 Tax=Rhodanobacter sp. L36 TaxID=1747221 RepID=UPI00131ABF65|nr:hypothetical protein [Rhodanobacter sp. L36]